MESTLMTFAEKLQELRKKAGVSEASLARACGLPFGTVHGYGLGRHKPTLAAAAKMAKALGVTCEAFTECEDIAGQLGETVKGKKRPGRRKRT